MRHDRGGNAVRLRALYGVEAIPSRWRGQLAMAALITDLADRLRRAPGV